MSTSGRFFLLFFLAWAALWEASARAVEGQPDTPGRSVRQRVAGVPSQDLRERLEPHLTHREVCEASEPLPSDPLGRAPAKRPGTVPPANGPSALTRSVGGPALSSDILLLIQRQNE